MKIGIITYWTSNNNYGQLLQCWALQQFLIKKGHMPYLIRFSPFSGATDASLFGRIKTFFTRVLKLILIYPAVQRLKNRKLIEVEKKLDDIFGEKDKQRDFDGFRKDCLYKTNIVYENFSTLLKNPPIADAYICGSDQIWNFNLQTDALKAFFLQFGNKEIKRIAYAPSIGRDYWPENRVNELKQYLSGFSSISLREETGVQICKDLGFDAKHVLDPTMLLEKTDYESLKETPSTYSTPYIFIYGINYKSKEDINYNEIKEYAKNKGMKIIITNGSGYTPCRELFDEAEYVYATIPKWLSLISNAELVITPSFHGVVFSILFHKNLMYTPLQGTLSRGNSRVLELFEDLGLNCFIKDDKRGVSEYITQIINWEKPDAVLNEKRKSSVNYIINAIK